MTIYRIYFKHDSAANWTLNNPILGLAEPAVESDTGFVKIGNGTSAWNSLPYFTSGGGGTATPDATGSIAGKIRLAGDLGGTAAAPTVPGLAAKANSASPTLTNAVLNGTLTGSAVTKAAVGLGSVDNTADASKPVSTAQASAIAAVSSIVSGHTASIAANASAIDTLTSTVNALQSTVNTLNALPKLTGQALHVGAVAPTDANILAWFNTAAAVADTTPPTAPTLAVPTKTVNTVILVWSGATDDNAVVGYNVYRGGVKVNTGLISASTYTDTGLTANTAYTHTIKAVDAAGNESVASNSRTTTTDTSADVTPPTPPTSLTATGITSTAATLTWVEGTDAVGVTASRLSIDNGATFITTTIPAGQTTYALSGLNAGTNYPVTLAHRDAAGNWSTAGTYTLTTASAVTVPGQVTGLNGNATSGQVALTWTAPASNGGSAITDYTVQYKLSSVGTWSTFAHTASTTAAATITGLTNGSSYDFRVAAVNAIGTSAAFSTTFTATPSGAQTTFSDTFTRADATDLGADWTLNPGSSFGISTNRATVRVTSTAAFAACTGGIPATVDEWAQITVLNPVAIGGTGVGPMVRVADSTANSWYAFRKATASTVALYKQVSGGSVTAIGSAATVTIADGDVLRIEAQGTTITGYVNGAALCTVTDSSVSGSAGRGCGMRVASNQNGALIDNFACGTL